MPLEISGPGTLNAGFSPSESLPLRGCIRENPQGAAVLAVWVAPLSVVTPGSEAVDIE